VPPKIFLKKERKLKMNEISINFIKLEEQHNKFKESKKKVKMGKNENRKQNEVNQQRQHCNVNVSDKFCALEDKGFTSKY
jgi:hypothetical protein